MTTFYHKNKIICLFLAFFGFFSTSCNDDTSLIGLELHPLNESLNIFSDTISEVQASTMKEDSSFVPATDLALFGLLNDPVFGFTNAGFMARVYTNSWEISESSLIEPDSAFILLNISGYYGNKNMPQSIQVLEMNKPILHMDTTYMNRVTISDLVYPVVLAEKTFMPKAQILRLRLPSHFNEWFITNFRQIKSDTNLTSNQKDSALAEIFKGFYFSKGSFSRGEALNSVNLATNSKLIFYIDTTPLNNKDTAGLMTLNFSTRFFNYFQHSYNQNIRSYLNDTSFTDSIFYIQSGNGLKAKLKFNDISRWTLQEKIAINRAQIIIPVDTTNIDFSIYPVPEQIYLKKINNEGREEYLEDFLASSQSEGISYKGAFYNSSKKYYSFDITRHFQKLVNEKEISVSYYLHAYKASSRAQRVVLCNKTHSRPIKLIVTYTKL